MRKGIQLFLVFLVSGFATLGIMGANVNIPLRLPQVRLPHASDAPQRKPDKIDPGARSANARQLAASGHLKEAQDEYLKILRDAPLDSGAMRGLAAVRRRLAADDPAALRRQAAAYRRAIARGVDTPEHYSKSSMELLASASLQAAAAVEAVRTSAPRAATATAPLAVPGTSAHGTSGASAPPAQHPTGARAATPAAPAPKQPATSGTPPTAPPTATPPPPPAPASPDPNVGIPVTPEPSSAPAQPAPAPAQAQETIAVLTPPGEPPVTPSQGSLVGIDCQKRTFVLRGANGDEEYLTTPTVTIYVRGAQSQRLSDFCRLQSYLGHAVTAWTVAGGDRKIAKEVSITL